MLQIRFNNTLLSLDRKFSLAEVLAEQNFSAGYFAVAVNRKFIAKNQYASTYLSEGDSVEVVAPMQGG